MYVSLFLNQCRCICLLGIVLFLETSVCFIPKVELTEELNAIILTCNTITQTILAKL